MEKVVKYSQTVLSIYLTESVSGTRTEKIGKKSLLGNAHTAAPPLPHGFLVMKPINAKITFDRVKSGRNGNSGTRTSRVFIVDKSL